MTELQAQKKEFVSECKKIFWMHRAPSDGLLMIKDFKHRYKVSQHTYKRKVETNARPKEPVGPS